MLINMKRTLLKMLLVGFLFLVATELRAQAPAFKGLYVYSLGDIMGNPLGEDILFRYCRDSSFNSITIGIGSFDVQNNPTPRAQLAAFIKKGRTRYGIKHFISMVYDYPTLINEVHYYQTTRTDTLEKFDYYNFEYEYWNSGKWNGSNTDYCTSYLQPGGYPCDSVGAWNYFVKNMTRTDSLAALGGAKTVCYIGLQSKNPTKNLFVADHSDLILLAAYHHTPTSLYLSGTEARLKNFSATSKSSINVAPIFASYTKDTFNLKRWLKIPTIGKHGEASAMPWYQSEFNAATGTWKSKINLWGWQWYQYAGMPKDSSSTAINAVPTGLTSTVSSTSANLSWTAVLGATGYRIMYSRANKYVFTTVNTSSNSYNLTGLLANTSYQFLVYAVLSDKTSGSSILANFTTSSGGATCLTPSGLNSSAITDVTATLNWASVSGATGYNIQYRIVGASTWITSTSTSNTKNLSGLIANSNYEFQIQTNCGSGNLSAFTASTNFTTTAAPCLTPNGLNSSGITTNSATVGSSAVGNATGYNIQYRAVGGTTWNSTNSATPTKTLSGLNAATSYEFQQQAVCPTNTSTFSTSSNFSTPAPPCNVPSGLSSGTITSSSAALTWTAVSGATSYVIQYRIIGASTWTSATSTSASKSISALSSSAAYEFQVQTVCSASSSSAFSASSTFSTPAPPCNVASGLSSASVTANSATISWSAVSGASSYAIQYRVIGTTVWIADNSATNSKSLSGLSASSNYEFQIQTICSASNSSAFSSSSTFTTAAPPCNVPTGLSSSSVTNSSAVLGWAAFAGATSYTVQYRIVGASTWISASCAVTTNSISGLTASSNYEFQVKSVCSASNSSAFSSSSTFSTPAPPCNTPSGLASSAVTNNAATLAWTAVAGVSNYNLRYRIVGASTWISATSTSASKAVSALTANSNYEFQVQSNCGSGNTSAFTGSSTFTTLATPCGLPGSLATNSLTYNSVTLNWATVAGASGYAIRYRSIGATSWTSLGSTVNSKNLSGLNSSTAYEFQVQSDCGSGNISAYTASANFTTPAPPCNAVSGLSATTITDDAATLGWIDFAGASAYSIRYRIVGSSTWTSSTSAINVKNITGLNPSANYEFQVQSDCGSGNTSAFSASFNFTTLAPPCNLPTGLTPSAVTNSSATLGWNSISGATDYSLQYRIVGTTTWTSQTSVANSYNLTGLIPNSTYEFAVQSNCAANNSGFSTSATFATSAPPCLVPSGLSVSGITDNAATLSWNAISGASTYNLQYRIVGTSVWTATSSAVTSKQITGLSASSNYEFQLQTECSSGNTSAYSASDNFSTFAAPCSLPTGLAAASITDNSAALSWTNLAGAISYNVQYRVTGTSTWLNSTSILNAKNISNLDPASTYEFQVQSDCGSGNLSAFTSSTTFTTLAPPCNIPTGLSTSLVSDNSAQLNWTAVSGSGGYTIQYRVAGSTTWTNTTSASNSKTLSPLLAATTYEFQVQSNCTSGGSSAFTATSGFTTSAPPCNIPNGLSASNVTYNSATINWTLVSGAVSYNVNYRVLGSTAWTSTTSATSSKTLNTLNASTTYEFQIQSNCGSGNMSAFSSIADFVTPVPPCNVPTTLSSSAISANSANLNWGAVSGAIQFNINYRIIGSSTWSAATSATNSKSISGLVASSSYEFQIQSDCGSGNTSAFSSSSIFNTPAPPCNAPSGLSSSAITSTTAAINWTAFAGANGYNIKYRIIGGSTWTTLPSTSTGLNLSNLTPSSNYEFKVQSDCGSGNISSFTTTSTFVTPAPPCLTPSGLSTATITYNSAVLNWSAVSGASTYNIQYREVGASNWTNANSATTSKTISGLNSSSNYEYQVQSNCGSGNLSSFSSPSTFSTPPPPCNVPVGLVASAITDVSANLDWTNNSGASGYNIRYRIVGATTWISSTSQLNNEVINGLTSSTNYEFQVQSDCGNGNTSAFSTSANFATTLPPCNVPGGLTATAVSNTDATLNWNSIIGATSYNVHYRAMGAGNWTSLTSNTNNITVTALSGNTTYEFEVMTQCAVNMSSYSAISTFATSAPPCTNASNLSSSAIGSDVATISWSNVSTANAYNIQYRMVGSSVWNSLSSNVNSATISGLTASSAYEFQIQTVCSSGNTSSYSVSSTFTTLAPPCNVPAGLTTAALTENSVTLNWTDFQGAIGYAIQYRIVGSTAWTSLTSTINTINLSGLLSASNYEFQIQSNCGSGNNSAFSASANFTTLTPPCNIPAGLGASAISANSVTIDWNSIAGAQGYNYRYRVVASTNWTSANSATNTVNLVGLAPSSSYEFQVQSDCGNANNSVFSSSSNFMTLAAPCAVPTGLGSSAITVTSATINWTAVPGAVGYTIQYRVSGSSAWVTLSSTSASKTLSGLNSAATYEFEIAADCGNSNTSAFSTTASFVTLAAPCIVPSGLNAQSNTPFDASINWTSASGAIAYTVQYRVVGTTTWLNATSNTNSAYISNLLHSSIYEYQVQSDCGSGNQSAFSPSANFTTSVPPCNIASGLAATNVTHNSAVLDWASVSGAASYNLQYRITGSGTWISETSNSSSKNISNLSATTNYEFQVQTVCLTGNSSAFTTSTGFTTDIPPCNVPVGLGSSQTTENSTLLSWTSFSGANSYNVQYRVGTSGNWTTLNSTGNSIPLVNLQPSTNYQFQIESSCSAGITSGYSSPSNFTTLAQPCIAPSGLIASSVTAATAQLNWNSLNNASAYSVAYRLSGQSNWITINASNTSVNISALTPASSYEFQVQSTCSNGTSPFSSIATFSTGNPSCIASTNLVSTAITETGATISWDPIQGASNYLVEYRVMGTNVWTSVATSSSSEILTGLMPASNYEFHVQTLCSGASSSSFSVTANFTTLAPPCGFPSGLNSAGATASTVSLAWDVVANAVSYTINYRPNGTTTWSSVTATAASVNLLTLTPATVYEFQVQTNCGYGLSANSNSSSFTTLASTGCDAPNGLFASSIKSSSAKLNWNPANGSNSYKVQYRKEGTTIWTNKTTSFTNKGISSLVPATQYEFQVQNNCNTSTSAYSATFLFTTAKSLNNLKSYANYNAKAAHSALGITLNWTASSETNLAFYTIERSNDNIEFEPVRNIAAAGNSTYAQDYEFNDIEMKLSPSYGTIWYRLSMTDNMGNVTYLRTIEVTQISEFEDVFKVYPNPTTDDNINLTVKLDHHEEMLVVLMDILGNQIYSKVVVTDDNGFAASGINPGKDLKPGIYEIVGYSSKRQMSKKLIIF